MAGGIDMLGWRQVMPKWEDDPVRRHIGIGGVGAGGGFPPPHRKEIGNQEEREGRVK